MSFPVPSCPCITARNSLSLAPWTPWNVTGDFMRQVKKLALPTCFWRKHIFLKAEG